MLVNHFIKTLVAKANSLGVNSLLDVGCGEGFILERIISSGFDPDCVCGVDISKMAINFAHKRLKEVDFKISDARSLVCKSNSYDLVLCNEVLEHTEEFEKIIKELLRVSKQYVLISVPWEPLFSYCNLFFGKNATKLGRDTEHVNFWSKKSLAHLVATFNIEVVFHKIVFPWQLLLLKLP